MYVVLALAFGPAHAGETQVQLVSPSTEIVLNRVTGQAFASAAGPGGMATASSHSWEMVCRAPCGTLVSTDSYYFVSGPGIPGSKYFLLPAAGQSVVRVDRPGSNGRFLGGVLMFALGSTAAGIGGSLLLAGGLTEESGLIAGGGAVAGIGGAIAIAGIPLWTSGATRVSVQAGP